MGLWEALNRREAGLIANSPALPARVPHPVLIAVTTAARGGGLWLAICVLEAVRPGGDRRLAARGGAAVVGALAVSHVIKRVVPHRPRPEPPGGRARRSLPETPASSSFPSSHAATAAAITTVLTTRNPKLAALVTPLTTAATYGRLRTRVHWPSDVAAGIAIGIGSAALLDRLGV